MAIVATLLLIVIPSVSKSRTRARIAQTATDLREIGKVLELYRADNNGNYPCFDHNWSANRETLWSQPYYKWHNSPIGHQYQWEHGQRGFSYSISINSPGAANAQALDYFMDDGNLNTGVLRGSGSRLEYGGMDQTVPLLSGTAHNNLQDCH